MPKRVKFEGNTYVVPDDATDAEIAQVLEAHAPKQQAAADSQPGFLESTADVLGVPSDVEGLKKLGGRIVAPLTGRMPLNAYSDVKDFLQGGAQRIAGGMKENYEAYQNVKAGQPLLPNIAKATYGNMRMMAPLDPSGGIGNAQKMGEQIAQKNYSGAAGTATGTLVQAGLAGKAAAEAARPTRLSAPLNGGLPLERGGPQMAAMPKETAGLPKDAVVGAEQLYRSAAPTGTNTGYRANLYAATPDLAEIAVKVEPKLPPVRGGLINPDMRVRAVVEEIGNHLDEMYKTERAPQIQRNANVPIAAKFGADASRGLEFLSSNAGRVADQMLADRALSKGTLTIAEADQLAQTANQELRAYERLPKDQQLLMRGTNPKIAGLKALDEGLKGALNEELMKRGEPGLTDYERRYAGLAEVRRGLRARVNEVELKQPGVIKGVLQPSVRLLTGGKSGLLSASQSAVADVNIGATLEDGLAKLRKSGLRAKRAVRQLP